MDKDSVTKRIQQTLKAEISAVTSLKDTFGEDFSVAIEHIASREGKIIATGIGKSGFIAMKMSATLTSLGHEATYLNPVDALHGDLGVVKDGDVLIIFSASGASSELVRLVRYFKEHFSIRVVTITSDADSTLAKLSDDVIHFNIDEEGCPLGLAPMASTTASLVIADTIASALTSPEVFGQEHFAKFHPAGSLGLSLKRVEEVMRGGDELPKIEAHTIFEEVLQAITQQQLAQIVGVVDTTGMLIGAVADGDIRKMLIKHGDLRGKVVGEFMNTEPKTINAGDNLLSALATMKKHKVNNLLVVDEGNKYIGFIHIHDIVGDYTNQ